MPALYYANWSQFKITSKSMCISLWLLLVKQILIFINAQWTWRKQLYLETKWLVFFLCVFGLKNKIEA